MEFTYDLSQTPIIGRRHTVGEGRTDVRPKDPFSTADAAADAKTSASKEEKNNGGASSPRRSVSLSSADASSIAGWKRPWLSQVIQLSITLYCYLYMHSHIIIYSYSLMIITQLSSTI